MRKIASLVAAAVLLSIATAGLLLAQQAPTAAAAPPAGPGAGAQNTALNQLSRGSTLSTSPIHQKTERLKKTIQCRGCCIDRLSPHDFPGLGSTCGLQPLGR